MISKENYEKDGPWGILTSLDLFECNPDFLRSEEKIRKYIIELCEHIDMKRFGDPMIVNFGADPRVAGYSLVQLIETSCISGHFANENNSIYIDIFSCKWYDQEFVEEFTKNFFEAKSVKSYVILRGASVKV